ncbi:MAG TPA: prepilin-type N-terminal cleavage/methylation domain-containing protein [Candidatus Limnocylindrales bacterium]|nr:prepilin-type N-terminal cleavage/methylation domain-containing protein [Candidatus Limnocylindrales bacterium]
MRQTPRAASGFSLIELVIAMGVLLVVTSIATSALLDLTKAQATIWNRTEMHSGVRGATELLQQEVGQAGRIAVPDEITLLSDVASIGDCDAEVPTTNAVTMNVSSAAGLFASTSPPVYELLTTMDGDKSETIKIASFDASASPPTITACIGEDHANGTHLIPLGSFATGIVPKTGIVNGSTDSVLKMYGDINGDGNMVYAEYVCDTTNHKLYRNVMPFDAATKPALSNSQVLLSNLVENPVDPDTGNPAACFKYQETDPIVVQGTPFTFVLDVAITLSVETEDIDPITRQHEVETKALLNVSPRNVLYAWMLVGMGYTDRVQSTPATVTALLADS